MNTQITIPCDECAHRDLCKYESDMRGSGDCIREIADTLNSVKTDNPFSAKLFCDFYLSDRYLSLPRGGANPCSISI